MMHKTPLLFARDVLNALMLVGMASLSFQSQAQFQAAASAVAAPSLGAAEAPAMGGGAAAQAAGLAGGIGNTGFMGTRLQPGVSIFIPEVLDRRTAYTQFIQGAKDWTAILYQFGLGAVGLKTLRN